MRDGLTQKIERPETTSAIDDFLARYKVKLVIVSAQNAGREISLDKERMAIGRGPGVDAVFDDEQMSRQHATIEFTTHGFRVRDLGSTNGILVNDVSVQVSEIKHGDRIEIGTQCLTVVIEERESEPEVYEIQIED